MITIITGHVVGLVLSFISSMFFNQVSGSKGAGTVLAVILLFALLELMVFSSIKSGRIYFRGFIYENEQPGKFKMQQFLYSLVAGFIVVISFFQFF